MAIAAFSCNNAEEIEKAYPKTSGPSEISEHLHIYVSRSARLQYEFSAPLYHVYHTPRAYQDTPKGFKLITFTGDMQPEMRVTARYGIYDEQKRTMEARDSVVIRNLLTDELIETEHLIWDMNGRKIFSDTKIQQTRPDGSVYVGESFESDESFSNYTIIRPQLIVYE